MNVARAFIASVIAFALAAAAAETNEALDARLKRLESELRCLVCQNQTIADSNAPLALDLRNQIRTQIGQGRSDDQIRTYMVERYGEFVLYKPPFMRTTAILWAGPFLLLLLGAVIWAVVARRAPKATTPGPQPGRRAEIEALLEERAADKPVKGSSPSGKR